MRRLGTPHARLLAAMTARCTDQPWREATLTGHLAQPGTLALIVEADGEPLGFVMARVVDEECEILNLGVLPDHRRRGLGRRLLHALFEAVPAGRCFLEVAADNGPAQALYAAEGFAAVARRPGYYVRDGRRVDALVMRRDPLEPPGGR